jgi:ABC-type lipoprotein release transport system permease subunit
VAGLAVSFAASRSLSSFLYGVQPHDRVTLLAVPGVLVLVAALACFLPARRASHIDPLRVLKGGG